MFHQTNIECELNELSPGCVMVDFKFVSVTFGFQFFLLKIKDNYVQSFRFLKHYAYKNDSVSLKIMAHKPNLFA